MILIVDGLWVLKAIFRRVMSLVVETQPKAKTTNKIKAKPEYVYFLSNIADFDCIECRQDLNTG